LEEGRPLEKELEGCLPSLQCLEAAARERERKEGRKKRKEVACPVCFCWSERIWFSNGDVCYVEAKEWFHDPGTILKEKTVQEQKEFGAGKRKVGRTGEILRDNLELEALQLDLQYLILGILCKGHRCHSSSIKVLQLKERCYLGFSMQWSMANRPTVHQSSGT